MTTEVEVKTKDQLLIDMRAAMASGDFKAVSKVSAEIAKLVALEEKTARDAVTKEAEGMSIKVRDAIEKALKPLESELEKYDGVWFQHDYSEPGLRGSARVLKAAKTPRTGGAGGGGKKFSITTSELLTKHGAKSMPDGLRTYQSAYDADSSGNSRYKVRMKLLKEEGLT